MSNEELVALIQGGERDRLPELWAQVEKFLAVQAHKRLVLSAGLGGVEFEDLYNAGYLALVAAADSFDPTAGRSFIGWLALALKTAFAEAGGYRSRKQARDPIHHAGDLDAPVGEGEDGATLGELQADPAAVQAFQDVEERLYRKQLHDALERALGTLEDNEEAVIRARYYQGHTLEEIGPQARTLESHALVKLRRSRVRRELEQFVEQRTPYYLRVGVQTFQNTGESAVERIFFKREQMRGKGVWYDKAGAGSVAPPKQGN